MTQTVENYKWNAIIEENAVRLTREYEEANTITLKDGKTFKNHIVLFNFPSFIYDYGEENVKPYTIGYIQSEVIKKFNIYKNAKQRENKLSSFSGCS